MSQYPAYPQQQPPPMPPPRRNVGLIVAIVVGSLVLAGTAIGITIALSGKASDKQATETTTSATRPSVKLPPGCDLLTKAQIAALIPGRVDVSRSSGPTVDESGARSECAWSNWHDPNRTNLPQVDLSVAATVVTSDEALKNTMHYSLGCGHPDDTAPKVTGADRSCVSHGVTDTTTGAPVDAADVAASHQMLVVEVHYNYTGLPIDRVDIAATNTAAAVLGKILQEQ